MEHASDVVIRSYEPGDLEGCRRLWHALTQHHRDIYEDPRIGGENPGRYFDEYLKHPKYSASWVAVRGQEIVGLTGLLVDGDEGEVEPVVVAPPHRRQGIGRLLLDFAIEQAREQGLGSVKIRPVARNAEAMRHFHAAGFQVLGHVEMFQSLRLTTQAWEPGITIHDLDFRQ